MGLTLATVAKELTMSYYFWLGVESESEALALDTFWLCPLAEWRIGAPQRMEVPEVEYA